MEITFTPLNQSLKVEFEWPKAELNVHSYIFVKNPLVCTVTTVTSIKGYISKYNISPCVLSTNPRSTNAGFRYQNHKTNHYRIGFKIIPMCHTAKCINKFQK